MFFFYLPSLHTYSCVSLSFMVLPVLYVHSLCLAHPRVLSFRKVKLENELAAQLWRVFWEDIQINNLEKTLRRTCSRLTLSMVRTHTHTLTEFTVVSSWTTVLNLYNTQCKRLIENDIFLIQLLCLTLLGFLDFQWKLVNWKRGVFFSILVY